MKNNNDNVAKKLELELLTPANLTPSLLRFLRVAYDSNRFELGRDLARKANIVNFSNCVLLLREHGFKFQDHWTPNPDSTPELKLNDLKLYKLHRDSRALASITLTAYKSRNNKNK